MLILYGSAYETKYVHLTSEYRRQNRILAILLLIEVVLFPILIILVNSMRNQFYSEFCSYLLQVLLPLFIGTFSVTLGLLLGSILKKICPSLSVPEGKRFLVWIVGVMLMLPTILLFLQALVLVVWHNAPQPIYIIFRTFLARSILQSILTILLPAWGGVFISYSLRKET